MIIRNLKPLSKKEMKEQIIKTHRRWLQGRPVYRQMNELRVAMTIATYDGKIVDDLPGPEKLIRGDCWYGRKFLAMLPPGIDYDSVLMNAVFSYVAMQSLQDSDTPNYFQLSDGLMALLQSTALRGVYPADIQLPFKGLYVEVPRGWLYWRNASTGYHPIEMLGLCERFYGEPAREAPCLIQNQFAGKWTHGRRLTVVVHGSANSNSKSPDDDGCGFFTIPLHSPNKPIEEMAAEDELISDSHKEAEIHGGKVGNKEVSGPQIRQALRTFALNFLLYLQSEGADVEHVNARSIKRLLEQREKKGKRFGKKRLEVLESETSFLVGSRVRITKIQREYGMAGGYYGNREEKAFRSLVRGHWRRQAHGPQRALRRIIWIKPHSRGGDGAVLGHDYVIM